MSSSVALYEALTTAPDDRARARVIAEAVERLEERYPHPPELVTQGHLRESELRLIREIEEVRAELKTDIEEIRADLRQTELRLQKEIEGVRADLKAEIEHLRADLRQTELRLQNEITRVKLDLLKWLGSLMFAQVAAIAALVKLL